MSGRLGVIDLPVDLTTLGAEQLRTLAVQLADGEREVGEKEWDLQYRQTRIDQLTHELSIIKRQQFGKRSEQFNAEQMSLLDDAIDTNLQLSRRSWSSFGCIRPSAHHHSDVPDARRCPHICHEPTFIMIPPRRRATADASWYA